MEEIEALPEGILAPEAVRSPETSINQHIIIFPFHSQLIDLPTLLFIHYCTSNQSIIRSFPG